MLLIVEPPGPRAERTLTEARVPFEVPRADALGARRAFGPEAGLEIVDALSAEPRRARAADPAPC